MIYAPNSASRTESLVFPPSTVDQAQAPIVLEKCGKGEVAYVGDTNGEKQTEALVFIMIGMWLRAGYEMSLHWLTASQKVL